MAAEGYDDRESINLGAGHEITIADLVRKVAQMTGFQGDIVWNRSMPDGQPRRSIDTTRARELFGFEATTPFDEGISRTIAAYESARVGAADAPA